MRKKVMAVVVAVLAFSLIAASAATLGGVRVNDQVGADVGVVASCDTDGVDVDFGVSLVSGAYVVDSVLVGHIADTCDGQTFNINLTDGAGGSLWSATTTVTLTGGTNPNELSWSGLTVSPAALEGVQIVISG